MNLDESTLLLILLGALAVVLWWRAFVRMLAAVVLVAVLLGTSELVALAMQAR